MIGRRELFGATAASLALAKTLTADAAQTAAGNVVAGPGAGLAKPIRGAVQPRGMDGRLVRLGSLDLESQQDYTLGFRLMHSKALRTASSAAFERVLFDHPIGHFQKIIEVQKVFEQLRVNQQRGVNLIGWRGHQQIQLAV